MATLAVSRRADLTDAQWAVLEPLLPRGRKPGRPPKWTKRQLIDGIRWRARTGSPWRDVPPQYGPWQTVYGLFRRWQRDGTWRQVLTALQARADAAGLITWDVSIDSTVARAHQHAAGARKRGIFRPSRPAASIPNSMITGWAGLAADSPPRSTWPASRARNPCPFSSPPGSAVTARSSSLCWNASVYPGLAGAGPATATGGSWPTRPTAPAATAPTCAVAGSGAPYRTRPTRSATARTRAAPAAAARLRPRTLQGPARGRVRHRRAEAQPGRRHPLRQARRPLRSHRPHRCNQRWVSPSGLSWSGCGLSPGRQVGDR